MKADDFKVVRGFLNNSSGIDFLDWENEEVLRTTISDNPTICKMALNSSSEAIGFILGGSTGLRGMLHHLYVKKEFRNQDIAFRLLEECIQGFKKMKVPVRRIFGLVYGSNSQSIYLLKKCGFILNPELDKNHPFVIPMYLDC